MIFKGVSFPDIWEWKGVKVIPTKLVTKVFRIPPNISTSWLFGRGFLPGEHFFRVTPHEFRALWSIRTNPTINPSGRPSLLWTAKGLRKLVGVQEKPEDMEEFTRLYFGGTLTVTQNQLTEPEVITMSIKDPLEKTEATLGSLMRGLAIPSAVQSIAGPIAEPVRVPQRLEHHLVSTATPKREVTPEYLRRLQDGVSTWVTDMEMVQHQLEVIQVQSEALRLREEAVAEKELEVAKGHAELIKNAAEAVLRIEAADAQASGILAMEAELAVQIQLLNEKIAHDEAVLAKAEAVLAQNANTLEALNSVKEAIVNAKTVSTPIQATQIHVLPDTELDPSLISIDQASKTLGMSMDTLLTTLAGKGWVSTINGSTTPAADKVQDGSLKTRTSAVGTQILFTKKGFTLFDSILSQDAFKQSLSSVISKGLAAH